MKRVIWTLIAGMAASFMGGAAMASTYYAVNSAGSFYVGDTSVIQAFAQAIHFDANNDVVIATNAGGYADAGIVVGFDPFAPSIKLGDLNTLAVTSSGAPLSVNLWLDTGADNEFFAFNGPFPGTRVLTGLDGDSYGGHDGTSIDGTSSFYMFAGSGAGAAYTLDQLKAGIVPGIDSNTKTALWIGLVGTGIGGAVITDVSINGISINAVPLPAAAWAGFVLLGGMFGSKGLRHLGRKGN